MAKSQTREFLHDRTFEWLDGKTIEPVERFLKQRFPNQRHFHSDQVGNKRIWNCKERLL